MKRVFRNLLALTGLLLMIASFVWMQLRHAERPAGRTESRTLQSPTASKPFTVVVLDPGHGGRDSGAMCGGVLEKDLTLDVARRIDRLLNSEGVATLMTRVGDSYVSLADRGTQARQFFVIANVTSPAVLIEGGFLTNKEDISKLATQDYRDQIAAAVADGILRYREAASQRESTLATTSTAKR